MEEKCPKWNFCVSVDMCFTESRRRNYRRKLQKLLDDFVVADFREVAELMYLIVGIGQISWPTQ